jgi:hypothetical protein
MPCWLAIFRSGNFFGDLDFSAIKETRPDELLKAWLSLTESQRNEMDSEFRGIFELSCERGFRAIIDEAEWHLADADELKSFVEKLARMANHFERAMVTFLDHNEFWKNANRFYHADTLPYWRKRKNMQHQAASVDETSLRELADQIRSYFHYVEGRGNNCVVEVLRRGQLDYFFAYPEDYSQQSIEWVNGEFDRRPHNPAFEVIYVYSQNEGSLDLNFRGSYKAIEPLQDMFARAILRLPEMPPDPRDTRVYNLNLLLQQSFDFNYEPSSGILSVALRKIRLSSNVRKGDRISLEADPSENGQAIYRLLEEIRNSTPLHLYNVTQVELAVVVSDSDKPAKVVTIRITYPNSCSLKYDELDLKLRDMLSASGIEPKESVEARNADAAAE